MCKKKYKIFVKGEVLISWETCGVIGRVNRLYSSVSTKLLQREKESKLSVELQVMFRVSCLLSISEMIHAANGV